MIQITPASWRAHDRSNDTLVIRWRFQMTKRNKLSRRAFLHTLGGMTGATALLAACGNTPPPGGATAPTAAAGGGAAAAPTTAIPPTPVPTPVPDRSAAAGRATVLDVQYPYPNENWE